jgi:perosamine synthetase
MSTPAITTPLVKVAMPPRERLLPALEKVLYSGIIAEGEAVYAFEADFARHFGLPNALAMNSGTAALHVALLMAGVGPGDEVITTSMTAEPTNTTILQTGAVPVFADVDSHTGNLDPEDVAACITRRTRAICVVHYAGYPARLDALRALADRYGIALIEDCAHALGAQFDGYPIGSIGDFAIFSFQAIKHMTTVDGGMLIMRDASRTAEARRLRWFGLTKGVPRTEVDITTAGFKYNMHNVAATIGMQQLTDIDTLISRHVANGRFFDAALEHVPGVEPATIPPGAVPSYWLYTMLVDDCDEIERRMAAIGVDAGKLHRPNHLHTVFASHRRPLPGLDAFYRRLLHLPCGWWVGDEVRERMVKVLRG